MYIVPSPTTALIRRNWLFCTAENCLVMSLRLAKQNDWLFVTMKGKRKRKKRSLHEEINQRNG